MRARLAFLALVFAALSLLLGCGTAKKLVIANLPPETVISVRAVAPDTLATVAHRVRLHWFGSDPDGDVVGYDVRFFNSSLPADTNWVRLDCVTGDCTDSLFTIFTPSGYSNVRFEVRAVDNQGAVDASPAVETFGFLNPAPIARFVSGPTDKDSTYATATVSWAVDDPGGDLSRVRFRVYLDGNEANYDTVYTGLSTATYTVPSDRFVQSGEWRTGFRKLYVRAIDDGGRLGPPDSLRWFVRAPNNGTMPATSKGRVLLVDNSFRTAANNQRVDTLYSNTLVRNLPAGTFSILRLEYNPGAIRSGRDLAQTFRLFDAVVWYRGYDTFANTILGTYQDSIGAYLGAGGRFYLEGLNLIQGPQNPALPTSPLRADFATRYLGGARLARYFDGVLGDSSVSWGNRTAGAIPPTDFRSTTIQDSVRLASLLPVAAVRAFQPTDSTGVMLWAKPGALEPPNPEQVAVALSVRQPSGGKAMVVGFPVREALPTYASSSRILAKLLFHPVNGLMAP